MFRPQKYHEFKLTDYYLHCANPVNADIAEKVREKLEYKEMLRAETPPDSKGAGLGFLTMARDASAPLEFEFSPPTADGTSMFYLRATI